MTTAEKERIQERWGEARAQVYRARQERKRKAGFRRAQEMMLTRTGGG